MTTRWRKSLPPLRPLAGEDGVTEGDVRMLLRPGFWPDQDIPEKEIYGLSLATRCALRALAGIEEASIVAMTADEALPGGRNSVIVTARGRTEEIPVTAALAKMLAVFKRRRTSTSPILFATRNGSLFGRTTSQLVNRTGRHLGFRGLLWDALKAYFSDCVARHGVDEQDVLCYEARRDGWSVNARLRSDAAVAKMIRAVDPFAGETLNFPDDAQAVAAARAAGAVLPPTYAECFARPVCPAADHPFMTDLATKGTPGSRRARERLYVAHQTELERMAADGSLPLSEQAKMFGVKKHAFRKLRRWARARAGLPPRPPNRPGSSPPRPPMTPTETARVRRIANEQWPPALLQEAFRVRLLAKHGPFVFVLVRQRKLAVKDAASLFRVDQATLARMKADFEVGLFESWLAPPLPAKERAAEAELLRREEGHRHPDQTDEDFCRAVRLRFGLKMTQEQALYHLRTDAIPEGSARPELTAEEQERLATIRNERWPRNWKVEDFRIDLFEQHGEFACALMECGKLGEAETARLFKVKLTRLLALRAALADGSLRQGPKPIATMAEAARRRQLMLHEYDRAPGGRTWPEFCQAFGQAHGLHLPVTPARMAIYAARPDVPREAFPTSATATPSDEERRRLRAISLTRWDKADNPAGLRRQIIRDEGAFLMRMMDERKVFPEEAGRLLRVRTTAVSHIRGAFRDGVIDHLIEPPLPPKERALAMAVVAAAHRGRRTDEGDAELLRRTRRQHVLLVPDEALLKALRAARRRAAR